MNTRLTGSGLGTAADLERGQPCPRVWMSHELADKAVRAPSYVGKLAAAIAFVFLCATGFLRAAEDERPVVDASKVAVEKIANGALPTFHIVGDSTDRKSTRLNSSH